jgi:dTMP kinase
LKQKGILIALEGLDGSGKTTHAHILNENLQKQGYNSEYTREPSVGKIGRFIQNTVLYNDDMTQPIIEALLFAADRVDHIKNFVEPKISNGRIIISDRYLYSSLAYQGARGVSLEWLKRINEFVPKPDIAFYIDVPPEVALNRKRGVRSVFEKIEFQVKVRNIYLEFVRTKELNLINGNATINYVQEELLTKIEEFLDKL